MGHLKRTLRTTGISLTVAGVGLVGAAGAASAHDDGGDNGQAVWGTVTAVGTGSFTITTHPGTTETIDTTATTTYAEPGTTVAPTGVVDGQNVIVRLDPSDATPTAVEVVVLLDRVSGKVTDVSATSITLTGYRGTTRDVVISPSTTYFEGKTSATGVTDGEFVTAFGTWDATTPTELDALFVDIGSKTTVCPPRSPRLAPTGTVPSTTTDPSTGTWGNHAPAPAPGAVSTTSSTPTSGTPPFSHGSAPQTADPAGHAGDGQGFGGGHDSGGPGAGGQGGHGFSGGQGGHGGRGF
jgi:hypothetical protein